jgi:hypothetical protein
MNVHCPVDKCQIQGPILEETDDSYYSLEDDCLLDCCALQSCRIYRRFRGAWRLIALMMEAASTSQTSVNCYQITEDQKTAIFIHAAVKTSNLKYYNPIPYKISKVAQNGKVPRVCTLPHCSQPHTPAGVVVC